ncbi:hypothetical protein EDD76_107220 [Kineothrix alysoides]|uniref:DUF2304 domain-containing protein n=1 Tax=Kineothrix alysoides TaxID=1469948 RepID=A0A4R1QYR0_9FIRM|nr:DUF2304 domain-containing protein [Kineothrix alysoides]TCL58104.1 hypothetical protein EDD76_107220 [Kineothrix alysoides]
MSITLRIFVCFTGIVLIYMARRASIVRKMTEKQSLFWISGGVIIILFGLIPRLVYFISDLFAVEYPPSIIFALAVVLAAYGIFNCYNSIAELSSRVQELAMQVSLLNEENSHLKVLIERDVDLVHLHGTARADVDIGEQKSSVEPMNSEEPTNSGTEQTE